MKQRLSKDQGLTGREKKFIKYFMECRKVGEAALRAGYAHGQYGSFLLGQDRVKTGIQLKMEKEGIDDEYLAKKLKSGLEAYYPEKRSKDGVVMQKQSPDFFTQDKYLDKAFKIRRDYLPEGAKVENKQVNIIINMNMAQGLLDSKKITKAEFEEITHEPIKDKENDREKERV